MIKKIILVFGILILGVFSYFYFQSPPEFDESILADVISLNYPSEYNFRQSVNDCGPFNVAAVVRAIKRELVSSAEFAETMQWRLNNNYTLPWGLEDQLRENGISFETPNLWKLSDEDKIIYLKFQLSYFNPIILLGEQDGFQHYITLLGYKKNDFFVYNSLLDKGELEGLTVDENGVHPGNMNMSSEELLEFWSEGGVYGIYNWYALVNSK